MPALLLRFWREGVIGLLLLALGAVWWLYGAQGRRLEACRTQHAEFVANVKAQTELARISDAAHKARVERDQEKARSENDVEIRRRIADAVAAVRLRGQPKAGNGGGSRAPVPSTPNTPSDPAGASEAAGVSTDDLVICAENTEKAAGWLAWWRSVENIER